MSSDKVATERAEQLINFDWRDRKFHIYDLKVSGDFCDWSFCDVMERQCDVMSACDNPIGTEENFQVSYYLYFWTELGELLHGFEHVIVKSLVLI